MSPACSAAPLASPARARPAPASATGLNLPQLCSRERSRPNRAPAADALVDDARGPGERAQIRPREPRALRGLWVAASPRSEPPGRAAPGLPVPRLPRQRRSHRRRLDQASFPADLLEAAEGDGSPSPHASPAARAARQDGCVGGRLGDTGSCGHRAGDPRCCPWRVTTGLTAPSPWQVQR